MPILAIVPPCAGECRLVRVTGVLIFANSRTCVACVLPAAGPPGHRAGARLRTGGLARGSKTSCRDSHRPAGRPVAPGAIAGMTYRSGNPQPRPFLRRALPRQVQHIHLLIPRVVGGHLPPRRVPVGGIRCRRHRSASSARTGQIPAIPAALTRTTCRTGPRTGEPPPLIDAPLPARRQVGMASDLHEFRLQAARRGADLQAPVKTQLLERRRAPLHLRNRRLCRCSTFCSVSMTVADAPRFELGPADVPSCARGRRLFR